MDQVQFGALCSLEYASDAGQRLQSGPRTAQISRIRNIDMRRLVVADGESLARKSVKRFSERARSHHKEFGLPQGPVGQDCAPDLYVAVLTHDPHAGAGGGGGFQERDNCIIQLSYKPGHITALRTV